MSKKRKKIILLSIIALVILMFGIVFLRHPKGRALLKSKSHFKEHRADSRILFEPGAEEYAKKIADFFPEAIKQVEKGHYLPFTKPFKVYVCSTQQSHNAFIGNPTSYPIRGSAFNGDVYIAPSAFSFKELDTHRESLMHELSHLHLRQRLGIFKTMRIPHWFREGLANIIAGSGGEGVTEDMAIQAIKEGRHFKVQDRGGYFKSLSKIIVEAGLTGPMFHMQNKMFVRYIKNMNPEAFKKLVIALQKKDTFSIAFLNHFEMNPEQTWERFKSEL
ncbi:MAG: hypothetical protein JSV46_07705 [Candidatus Aminicenantes bacterium]|nr:MAG: hypothetical protein JSV46_07705 [Candidatus Aminicenantes bacterium]